MKRFVIETSSLGKRFGFISEERGSKLTLVSMEEKPILSFAYRTKRGEKKNRIEKLVDFVEVKGWKAMGNKLGNYLRMSSFNWSQDDDDLEISDVMDDESIDELTLFN